MNSALKSEAGTTGWRSPLLPVRGRDLGQALVVLSRPWSLDKGIDRQFGPVALLARDRSVFPHDLLPGPATPKGAASDDHFHSEW